jgi:HEPN domain-containing protein
MKKITDEWLKYAQIDIRTAAEILDDEALTPSVAFHSHQCIEKTFKALLAEYDIIPPKRHNLLELLEIIKTNIGDVEISLESIKYVNETYIDSRYPNELGLLPKGLPSTEIVKGFYELAEEIMIKIKSVIKKKDDDPGYHPAS